MNIFNNKEFEHLRDKLNSEAFCEDVTISYPADGYYNKVKRAVATDRRGEVVFCVVRPNGKAVAVTCEEYPKGIFRIPTGGVGHREDIIEAVHRECKEELGLEADICKFAGVLKIRFEHGGGAIMFYSYIFILKETGGRLLEDASDNEVSEVVEVGLEGLEEIAEKLNGITGKWSDWGKFRYTTTSRVLRYLREANSEIGVTAGR